MIDIHISWIGVIYILGLLVPNLFWTKHQPIGYDSMHENKVLLIFERVGQILTSCFAIISFQKVSYHSIVFLVISMIAMLFYEGFWVRYFKSPKTIADFYISFLGMPLAGATYPIIAFLCLGISLQNIFLVISTILLGIGHIGIHFQHFQDLKEKQ